ncbi:DMT family transporter [Candidatus Woesearchaeota archaeon]|nr:DMT family transporter [Candidatus Woesearchaeota archaeon]
MLNPYLAVVIATIIWGSSGVFIRYLNLPPSTLAFFRTFVPTVILLAYFIIKKINPFRDGLKLIFLASSIGVMEFFLYFVAYKNTSIANSVIVLYTWPVFAAVLSAIFLRETVSKKDMLLFLAAFTGVIFVYARSEISLSDKNFVGVSSMLIAAILFAFMIIIFKKLSSRHSNYEIIFYHNFMSAIVFLPILFINRSYPTASQSAIATVYALLIGLFAYIPYYFGLKHLKASTLSLISYLEVVSGILFAIVLLHDTLTLNAVVGGALIIGSTVLIKK